MQVVVAHALSFRGAVVSRETLALRADVRATTLPSFATRWGAISDAEHGVPEDALGLLSGPWARASVLWINLCVSSISRTKRVGITLGKVNETVACGTRERGCRREASLAHASACARSDVSRETPLHAQPPEAAIWLVVPCNPSQSPAEQTHMSWPSDASGRDEGPRRSLHTVAWHGTRPIGRRPHRAKGRAVTSPSAAHCRVMAM